MTDSTPGTDLLEAEADATHVVVRGEPLRELPRDLYIPPDALEVFLEAFEGPLDLLLYLIRRHNVDILDIPIAEITTQYMEYVELMKELQLELAAEYLVMAAVLAEIKSRMLLPRPPASTEEEDADPRAELVRRLQEYERYKTAGEGLDELPRMGRDVFVGAAEAPGIEPEKREPDVSLQELMAALADVMARAEMFTHHQVQKEALSVRERMSELLSRLDSQEYTRFTDVLASSEGRAGVVVSFLALLELIKGELVQLVQAEPLGPIYIRASA